MELQLHPLCAPFPLIDGAESDGEFFTCSGMARAGHMISDITAAHELDARFVFDGLFVHLVLEERDPVDRPLRNYSSRLAAPVGFSFGLIVVPHSREWGKLIYAVSTDRSISALGRNPAFGEMRLRRTFPANRSG